MVILQTLLIDSVPKSMFNFLTQPFISNSTVYFLNIPNKRCLFHYDCSHWLPFLSLYFHVNIFKAQKSYPMNKSWFILNLRQVLLKYGLSLLQYAGLSLMIGTATSVAMQEDFILFSPTNGPLVIFSILHIYSTWLPRSSSLLKKIPQALRLMG